jgi:cysteine desulfurase/selenocysteine lyase
MRERNSEDPSLDIARMRADFPILEQEINGRPLVYLDNAASAQKPLAVIDAIRDYYLNDNANVHRGVHTLSQRATDAYEAARETARGFINAASTNEIVFTRGTTEAINLVAATLGDSLKTGDEILLTQLEHHSNIVPWQMTAERTGATIKVAPLDSNGDIDTDEYNKLVNDRTRIVALAHVSNALGTVNPVKELIAVAREHGAIVLLDGAQAVPHMRVDVAELGCDFYAFSGHKMLGPTGIGVLYGRETLLATMPPWQGGGEMILTVSFENTTYNDLPFRYEAGTPNMAGAIGLAAAMDYLDAAGLDKIEAYEKALVEYATNMLVSEVPGLRLIGTPRDRAGVISFAIGDLHPHDIGTIVDHHGVAVRTGHHCAMPLMESLGLPGTTRASFALYNTRDDVHRLVDALLTARQMLQ